MENKNYTEKLRDPRWQKKRLKVFERDNWTCQMCGETEKELQINHKKYTGEPWEAPDEDLETLCCDCHEGISPINTGKSIKECLENAIDLMEKRFDPDYSEIKTGIRDFDDSFGGFFPGLSLIGSRPGMGLTSMLVNIVIDAAKSEKKIGFILSESIEEEFSLRLATNLGCVDRGFNLEDDDWARLTSGIKIISETDIVVFSALTTHPNSVLSTIKRWAQDGVDLIIIDSLNSIVKNRLARSYENSILDFSLSVSFLGKDKKIPIVAGVSLGRNLEQRPNRRPVFSDIGKDQDVISISEKVIFLFRDEVYNEDSQDKGLGEIIVSKNNNGPTGTVRACFIPQYGKWTSFEASSLDEA